MKRKIFTFISAALLLFCNAQAQYFIRQGGKNAKDGSSWSNAAPGLPNPLVANTIYYIAAGNYGNNQPFPQVALNFDGIVIMGGFPDGNADGAVNNYDPATNKAVFTCASGFLVSSSTANPAMNIQIKGIYFSGGGFGFGPSSNNAFAGNFTFSKCNFTNLTTGIALTNMVSGTVTVDQSYFTLCNSGAFNTNNAQHGVSVAIQNSTFYNNSNAGGGGAISAGFTGSGDQGSLAITNSNFCSNSASQGGAIWSGPSTTISPLSMSGCVFSLNTSTSGRGGAVYIAQNNDVAIKDSKFYNNTASTDGGALAQLKTGTASFTNTIDNCIFYGNTANEPGSNYGGGALNLNDGLTSGLKYSITNSKFVSNKVTYPNALGGAIAWLGNTVASSTSLSLNNCLFYGNKKASVQEDIKSYQTPGSTPLISATNMIMQLPTTSYDDFSDNYLGSPQSTAAPIIFTSPNTFSNDGTTGNQNNGGVTITTAAYNCPNPTVVLPVVYTNFSAIQENKNIILNWATVTETNNSGFAIERSTDGINFTKIGFVASKAKNGISKSLLDYSSTDANPLAGTNFYRLKQIDFDGRSTTSNVVTVIIGATKVLDLNVYPTPINTNTKLVVSGVANFSNAYIIITNYIGQIMSKQSISQAVTPINFSQFPNGIYYIKYVDAAGNNQVIKVVK